jgi:CRISPR-associated protein Cmr2
MTFAVLIFTLSPVQSFIAEARRTADLFVGSAILSELAKAAAQAIGTANLVYPAPVGEDVNVPNVLVAYLPAEEAPSIARHAEEALHRRWQEIADSARQVFAKLEFVDETFDTIWNRQIGNFWEIYWTIAAEDTNGYTDAYQRARVALDAVKRSRLFAPSEEPGIKDTLSGQREALHAAGQASYHGVKSFWQRVAQSPDIGPSRLRPQGRERLDAIGATKRFCYLVNKSFSSTSISFPSTSTVAALDFIKRAQQRAPNELRNHYNAVAELLGSYAYQPRKSDLAWPFDGDLLFEETFTPNRLEDSYALTQPDPQKLGAARQTLRALYKAVGDSPSTYYALLVFDGDDMGRRISECLQQANPRQAHTKLSQSLVDFAARVRDVFKDAPECLIYNGGDDVMAFLPIEWALTKARALAANFEAVACSAPVFGTASAGLALVHHLHPLDAALRAARAAEAQAKQAPGKAALCITALKRSGEQVTAVTRWDGLSCLSSLVNSMKQGDLAFSFVSDAMLTLEAIPPNASEMLRMELRRQMRRHGTEAWVKSGAADQLADHLTDWTDCLPQKVEDLRNWISIARFIVRESSEEAAG